MEISFNIICGLLLLLGIGVIVLSEVARSPSESSVAELEACSCKKKKLIGRVLMPISCVGAAPGTAGAPGY